MSCLILLSTLSRVYPLSTKQTPKENRGERAFHSLCAFGRAWHPGLAELADRGQYILTTVHRMY